VRPSAGPRSPDTDADHARRSVVPKPLQPAAGRSLWPAAVWTGLGAVVVCATLAIVVVAACWLPVSGTTGRTNSAIRAGLLTFLAALHGGVTVDGVSVTWLPLGMLVLVGLTAWRAGSGLADAAEHAGDVDPGRLALAGLIQTLSFTVGCLVAVPFATLGTSRAPFFGVGIAAAIVFTLTAGSGFVRSCEPLRDWIATHIPPTALLIARAGTAAAFVYVAAGAVLSAASLVLHHSTAERLSHSVGGGLGGIPVLLLGVLAAPNVAIAGAGYLAGPGFALGSGTHVGLFATTSGLLPAFPVLAAVPSGGPNPAAWGLAALTPLVAGLMVARHVTRVGGWWYRVGAAAAAAAFAGVVMFVLGWQGGGAVGDGRLHTVGVSAWQVGAAVAVAVLAVSAPALALAAGWQWFRTRAGTDEWDDWDDEESDGDSSFFTTTRIPRLIVAHNGDDEEDDENVEPDVEADVEDGADDDLEDDADGESDGDADSDDATERDHLAG
jgi:hypothetical protein